MTTLHELHTLEKEQKIITAADNMASAAVSFSSHGYDQFLRSREQLIEAVHEALHEVSREFQNA